MTMADYRIQINNIDDNIVDLIGNRLQIVRHVAQTKKSSGIPVMQPNRVQEVKSRCRARASQNNVSEEFVDALYQMIIDEACRIEYEFMDASRDLSANHEHSKKTEEGLLK